MLVDTVDTSGISKLKQLKQRISQDTEEKPLYSTHHHTNPVAASDDADDNIFEQKISFSGVFNSSLSQWCVKKGKHVFKFAFRFHAFPENLEMLETRVRKKFNLQHHHETKMSHIIVFSSNCEIKMPRNVVFRLNCQIETL